MKIFKNLFKKIDCNLLAIPLKDDAMSENRMYNSLHKIYKYFKENKVKRIKDKIKILNIAMGSPKFYPNKTNSRKKLEYEIVLYLSYLWFDPTEYNNG